MLAVLRDDVQFCCPISAPDAKVRCNWRIVEAGDRGWVWQRNGPNTRKQPPGNSNSDSNRNAQQTIKACRVAEEGKGNDSTAQHSTAAARSTHREHGED